MTLDQTFINEALRINGGPRSRTICDPRNGKQTLVTLDRRRWDFLASVCAVTPWIGDLDQLIDHIALSYVPEKLGVDVSDAPLGDLLLIFADHHNETLERERAGLANDNSVFAVNHLEGRCLETYQRQLKSMIRLRETMKLPRVCAPFRFIAHPRTY